MGLEIAKRQLDVPSLIEDRDFTWDESTAYAYAYKALRTESRYGWQVGLFLEAEFENIERPVDLTGPEGIVELDTYRIPVGLRIFGAKGISVRVATTYVEQTGTFSADPIFGSFRKNDSAWIADVSLEYRFPRRKGNFVLGASNITDDFIDLLETDPLNPRVATRQILFAKLRINF